MKFPKLVFRRGVPLISADKKTIGRVPAPVARELVTSNHATVLRNNPAIIGLKSPANKRNPRVQRDANSPLKQLIATATMFVAKSGRAPALSSLLFTVDRGSLTVSATNLDAYFTGYVSSSDNQAFGSDTDADGVCIDAMHLKRILSCADETAVIHIKGGDTPGLQVGSFFVEGFSPDGFPAIPSKEIKGNRSFTITDISQKLSFVGKAVSNTKYKAALSGMYIDTAHQQLAGSDGNRMHIVPMNESCKTQGVKHDVEGVIVPASILKAARLLTGDVQICEERNADRYVSFALNVPGCTNCRAVYRAIDGQFPQYNDVIPREFASRFTARTRDMLPVLNKALIASAPDSDSKPITAEFRHGQMIVTANVRGRTTYRGAVQGQYNGAPYCGVVNAIFLLDAIQTSGDSVEILLQSGKDQAWTIQNSSGYKSIVMPIELES